MIYHWSVTLSVGEYDALINLKLASKDTKYDFKAQLAVAKDFSARAKSLMRDMRGALCNNAGAVQAAYRESAAVWLSARSPGGEGAFGEGACSLFGFFTRVAFCLREVADTTKRPRPKSTSQDKGKQKNKNRRLLFHIVTCRMTPTIYPLTHTSGRKRR